MGNLRSVEKAFEQSGEKPRITSSRFEIERAHKIVLPGVGAFDAAMRELERRKLLKVVRQRIEEGVPYLGLCLGLQILLSKSEESDRKGGIEGLNIIKGVVRRFRGRLKIPHMGWNTVSFKTKSCAILDNVKAKDHFYFVHSYYADPEDSSVIAATTPYGRDFCSVLCKDNIYATQFHPEKSQRAGLRIIKNFIRLKP